MKDDPRLTVVITTLGRIEALKRNLDSLAVQLEPGDELVVVAQGNVAEVETLVHAVVTQATTIYASSDRGACRGRNVGVEASSTGNVLLFPNDTTWFPEGSIAQIRQASAGHDVVAYTVRDEAGPKFVFSKRNGGFNYRTVWDVIEPGFAMSRRSFEQAGGFDPGIGTGANSPWQAGEVADLLYRWKAKSQAASMSWRPDIEVGGATDSAGLNAAERRRKLRAYGRGCGFVMRRHRSPVWFLAAYIVAGLLVAVKRPQLYQLTDGWSAAVGRLEGVTGHIWGGEFRAVNK